MRTALLLAMLLATSPAFAMSAQKSGGPAGTQPVKSSAVVRFQIVIPDTLQLDPPPLPRRRADAFVSRTVTLEDGRSVVTVAKP
ncbi:MAG: hypothetical protein ACJ8GK_06760 [Luteimonas sp.]